jgi:hypothetical protein
MDNKKSLSAYFKELNRLSGQLGERLSYITEEMEKPANSMKLIYKEIESFGKKMNSNIGGSIDLSKLADMSDNLQKVMQKMVIPVLDDLKKSFQELPEHIQEVLLLLGENGWYLDFEIDLTFLWNLRDILDEGNIAKAEDALIEHYERRAVEIEKILLNKFPHRANILKATFGAHQRGEYYLSIPVFLAQTDGICKEVFGQYLFIKSNGRPQIAMYVNQIVANNLTAVLLSPLAETLPINASERERPTNFTGLNRHMVLHGESLDYGNKINSLKAISLINYISQVVAMKK